LQDFAVIGAMPRERVHSPAMRIGYPCTNRTLGCRGGRTLRLASFSLERLDEIVSSNLRCLETMLHFNVEHGIRFFRISSDLIPFASHPEIEPPWRHLYARAIAELGPLIQHDGIRIDMHPGQYTVLNSPDEKVAKNAVRDLVYHVGVLDEMGLDPTAKVQIHLGGVYGDRETSLARFIARAKLLPETVRRRLAIENDERSFGLADCLRVAEAVRLPVLLDVYHHRLKNDGESLADALVAAAETWSAADGVPMVDYSLPLPGGRFGQHAETLDDDDFRRFVHASRGVDVDVMLEIKDKELSALRAVELARGDPRFVG
jgi:UV DNA damage endonuclease